MGRTLSPVFFSVAGAFISLSAWCLVYLYLCHRNTNRRAEWHCRVTTVIHAILICSLASYAAIVQGPWPFSDPGGTNTPLQRIVVMICLGYFIFDLAWCLKFQTEGVGMLTHHALSILGLSVTLLLNRYGTEIMASIVGTEITNPLLQLRWFLRETGRGATAAAIIINWIFVLSFGFFRIGMGSYLLYTYFQNPKPDWLGRFGGFSLYLIGWVFWIQLCRYSYRKIFRPKPPRGQQKSCHVSNNDSPSHSNGCHSINNAASNSHSNNGIVSSCHDDQCKTDHVNNILSETASNKIKVN